MIILSVSKLLTENSGEFGFKTPMEGENLFCFRSLGIVLLVIKYDLKKYLVQASNNAK